MKRGSRRRQAPPPHRPHRRRSCPRLARALGRRPSARTRSARRSSTARSGVAAPPTSRPASPWPSRRSRTLDRAGVKLAGDVVLAFVGDEESGEPGTGVSAGMKALDAAHRDAASCRGPISPSMSSRRRSTSIAAQMGFFIADIEVTGRTAYFGVPEHGVDALKATHAHSWRRCGTIRPISRRRGNHPLVGRSFLLVTGDRGRRPDRRAGALPPQPDPQAPAGRGPRPRRETSWRRSSAAPSPTPTIRRRLRLSRRARPRDRRRPRPRSTAIHRRRPRCCSEIVRGASPGPRADRRCAVLVGGVVPHRASASRPSISRRATSRICHTLEERVPVAEYLAGIAAMAEFIARYCGVAANETEFTRSQEERHAHETASLDWDWRRSRQRSA